MANEKSDVASVLEALPGAIAKATLELQNQTRQHEVANPPKRSHLNPTGGPRPALTRKVNFCGHDEEADSLTDEEIRLYNRVQAGDYNNGAWKVRTRKNGNDEEVFIALPVSDPDQRLALPNKLSLILQQILDEAAARK